MSRLRIAGFTLVSHAVRLDFPIVPVIRSLLQVCDEVVVNVGPAGDGTIGRVEEIADPRVRVIRGAWDHRAAGRMLAVESNRALASLDADWAIYLQADEVLHEADAPRLRAALEEAHPDQRIEGLLFEFLHFYGSFRRIATNRTWIRREVRAVRPGSAVESYAEAQGFRTRPTGRPVRARPTGCRVFHYGWARPIAALNAKRELDHALYHARDGRPMRAVIPGRLPRQIGLVPYADSHPAVAQDWIAEREGLLPGDLAPLPWNPRQVQLGLLHGLERLTGWRPFEFRNYAMV